MKIRDRIKELRRVKAKDLLPNERNWRTHPKAQREALQGVLAEVGYADALVAYETPGGELKLIDGHLRAETTPDMEVPVLILDVSEDEANKILMTMDPLAAMAESDATRLDNLLREVQTSNEAVAGMLADLAEEAGLYKTDGTEGDVEEGDGPALSDGVINYNLIFDTEAQQDLWYKWLKQLKDRMPHHETHAARIHEVLQNEVEEE